MQKSSILVVAIGRHEFLHGSIDTHLKNLKACIPTLRTLVKKKRRIIWVLPAAPRRHHGSSKSKFFCQKYVQRWDQFISYIEETKSMLESVPEIEVIDMFSVTTSAHPDWYSDNLHMHKTSSLSRILSQIILNLICAKY